MATDTPYREEAATHHVAGLSFTPERLEARRRTLGASEIAAVAGLARHRTALDVYLEKRGLVPPFEGNEFTEWGLRLEAVIAEKYAELMGAAVGSCGTLAHVDEPWATATPDRLVLTADATFGLEIKNKGARQIVHWGEAGSDQVPHEIAAQCHWSMIVTGYAWWDVAVLFGGNQFRHYRLHADAEIAGALFEQGRAFWFRHVEAGVEPAMDGSRSASEYLKRRFASHTELVREATREEDRLVEQLREVRAKRAALEADEATIENRIKLAIGDAAGIVGRSGRVTWKASKPTRTTDYREIATQWLDGLAPGNRAIILDAHTTEKPGSRRFLLTIPKED